MQRRSEKRNCPVSTEQNEHGNGKADEARGFCECKAEEQRAALAGGGGWIAQRARQVVSEDCADTNASATEGMKANENFKNP